MNTMIPKIATGNEGKRSSAPVKAETSAAKKEHVVKPEVKKKVASKSAKKSGGKGNGKKSAKRNTNND